MVKGKRKLKASEFVYLFVFASLVLSIIFVSIKLALAPSEFDTANPFEHLKSQYVLMLVECVLGVIALLLPTFINKKWSIKIPNTMLVVYVLYLYAAIYLGEVRSFYYKFPDWDTVLHVFSGAMLGALGFSIVNLLSDNFKVEARLSPLFISLFAFFFASTLGVLWEIYEFLGDGLFFTNMQKYMTSDGTMLIGRAAVFDTMKDLIVDLLGSLATCVVGYFSICKKPEWMDNFRIRTKKEDVVESKDEN